MLPLSQRWLIDAAAYPIAPLLKTGWGARLNARALKIPPDQFEGYRRSLRATTIRTPTLLLAGEHEHPLILASMAQLRKVLPVSQTRLAEGAGHAWNGELPLLFSATVRGGA